MGAGIYIGGDNTFNGATTTGTLQAGYGGCVTAASNMTGSVTGPRYCVSTGGRILTGGRGVNAIPGTEPGACDDNSVYA